VRRRPTLILAALLAGFVLLPLWAGAQEEERKPAGEDGRFREEVEVRLIELSAVFLDREGRPVRDMKPKEVTIRAGGRRYEPAFLELAVRDAPERQKAAPADVMLGIPGGSDTLNEAMAGPRGYYIVLVDVENDAPQTRGAAASQLSDFIFKHLRENDLVSVMSFDGDMNIELPFSASHEAISQSISKAYQRERRAGISTRLRIDQLLDRLGDCSGGKGQDGRRIMNSFCVRNLLSSYMEEVRPDIVEYFEALETLIRYAGSLQGQVTVFAVTHGKTSQPSNAFMEAVESVFGFTRETSNLKPVAMSRESLLKVRRRRLLRTALEQDVVLYVLDRTGVPGGLASAEYGGGFEAGAQPFRTAYLSESNDMAALALDTGGNLVRNFDLEAAAAKAYERERGRYVLGFYPEELLDRDDLEDIEVDVERKGVRIETGRAFYAGARSEWVLSGSIEAGEPRAADGPGERVLLPFTIRTDPRGLAYQRSPSATINEREVMRAELSAHVTLQTKAGVTVAEAFHTFSHEYDVPIWQAAREKPLVIPGQVVAEPGTYRLIVKLRNYRVGRGGQLMGQLELAPPAE
jgi:VWFA-related protein